MNTVKYKQTKSEDKYGKLYILEIKHYTDGSGNHTMVAKKAFLKELTRFVKDGSVPSIESFKPEIKMCVESQKQELERIKTYADTDEEKAMIADVVGIMEAMVIENSALLG